MTATGGNGERSWIEERHRVNDCLRSSIHHGEARRKPVEDVETMTSFVERQAAWSFTQFDGQRAKTVSFRVDDHKIPRTHAGHVAARAVRAPNHSARIANRLVALRRRQDGR